MVFLSAGIDSLLQRGVTDLDIAAKFMLRHLYALVAFRVWTALYEFIFLNMMSLVYQLLIIVSRW